MFPNLNAEQARLSKSNEEIAGLLGVSRVTYEARKNEGRFSISDANKLCDYFACDFAYLFSEVPLIPRAWTERSNA